eukprot:NODE_421_length_8910_cov_0.283623.p2 type:complete len:327 gc:universal NODE_421_length_8910_cov_0.283623:4385-5365(+)
MFTFLSVTQVTLVLISATVFTRYSSKQFDFGIISVFCGILNERLGLYLKYVACYIYIPLMYFYYENESKFIAVIEYLNIGILLFPFVVCYPLATLRTVIELTSILTAPFVHAVGFLCFFKWVIHLPIPLNYVANTNRMIINLSMELHKLRFQVLYYSKFKLLLPAQIKSRILKLEGKFNDFKSHLKEINPAKENMLFLFCCISIIFSCFLTLTLRVSAVFGMPYFSKLWSACEFMESLLKILGSGTILKEHFHLEPIYYLKYRKRLKKKPKQSNHKKKVELNKNGAFMFNSSLIVLSSLKLPEFEDWKYQFYYVLMFIVTLLLKSK